MFILYKTVVKPVDDILKITISQLAKQDCHRSRLIKQIMIFSLLRFCFYSLGLKFRYSVNSVLAILNHFRKQQAKSADIYLKKHIDRSKSTKRLSDD